jgi:hypothetical protein
MIDVLKLWASYKENEKTIKRIRAKNENIEKEILTLFSDAWEKKHGCRTPKGTIFKIEIYDFSARLFYGRNIEKGEDAVGVLFIDLREGEVYDATAIPIKAFLEKELDPDYLTTREDMNRLKRKRERLNEERMEYERLKKKFGNKGE